MSFEADTIDRYTPIGFIFGARLSFSSVSKLTIGTIGEISCLRDSTNAYNLLFTGLLNADMAITGAGGLRSGLTEAADTWYAILLIGDTSDANTPKGFIDISHTTPILPSGYDVFRRVGWARNNSSSDFLNFSQTGSRNDRRYWYYENAADVRPLQNGNATSFTAVDCSSFIPPTSRRIAMRSAFSSGSGGGAATASAAILRPTGITMTKPVWRNQPSVHSTVKASAYIEMPCDSSQSIDYSVTASANKLTIIIMGYNDEV